MYEFFARMYGCACIVPTKVRKGYQISWIRVSEGCNPCVWGSNALSSIRATNALNLGAFSPAPPVHVRHRSVPHLLPCLVTQASGLGPYSLERRRDTRWCCQASNSCFVSSQLLIMQGLSLWDLMKDATLPLTLNSELSAVFELLVVTTYPMQV